MTEVAHSIPSSAQHFETYLKEAGIQRRLTVPYSPQSNGVAERFNRTLMEAVRCMLKASALPNSMWGEAVMNATYVLARVPHRALGGTSPHERWFGQAPSVGHLRPFGCVAYAWVPPEKPTKLDDVSRRCHLLGYATEARA